MRKIAFGIATATAVVASPAVARDNQWYAGPEFGVIFPDDSDYERLDSGVEILVDNDRGWDGDLLIGYDFGMVRFEAEAGYKTWDIDALAVPATNRIPSANFGNLVSGTFVPDGNVKVMSSMLNALLDFGGNDGVGFSVGLGAGIAGVDTEVTINPAGPGLFDSEDTAFAWQGIAALRIPVGDSVDIGLKYRYFNIDDLDLVSSTGVQYIQFQNSHSVLASVLFNWGATPPNGG